MWNKREKLGSSANSMLVFAFSKIISQALLQGRQWYLGNSNMGTMVVLYNDSPNVLIRTNHWRVIR